MARNYTREEVEAILARALEKQRAHAEGVSHEELLAIGRELGVGSEALEAAASTVQDEMRVEERVEERVRRSRRGFTGHLLAFVMVNLLFVVANVISTPVPWSLIVALAWGIGLAFHARAALRPDRERLAERARRALERERAHEGSVARRREIERGALKLEKAVEVGLADVLSAVADVIDESRTKAPASQPTGVRVDAPPDEKRAEETRPDAAREDLTPEARAGQRKA